MAVKETVIIGCKLPHGLYLDIHDKAGNLKSRVKLPGCAGFTLPNPDRKFQNPETVHGDTLTAVDKDHWEEWWLNHSEHPAITSGAIYMAAKRSDAESIAKEHEHDDVGFSKVDPNKEPVKKLNGNDRPF
ncbi:MAG: hypothetical protein ABFD89_09885 [Bryobacteraceae bacterium]